MIASTHDLGKPIRKILPFAKDDSEKASGYTVPKFSIAVAMFDVINQKVIKMDPFYGGFIAFNEIKNEMPEVGIKSQSYTLESCSEEDFAGVNIPKDEMNVTDFQCLSNDDSNKFAFTGIKGQ